MNGEHPSIEHLHCSHDGELLGGDASAVRSHLASCARCARELGAVSRLGDLVRMAAEDASSSASEDAFARMFANIESAIADDAGAVAAPVIAFAPKKVRWVHRAAPALGAVALAAAALLMVYRPDAPNGDGDDAPYEAATAATGNGGNSVRSEVVEVDFGSNAGTVFDIPLADGSSIPVVWIDDDDDEE